MGIFQTKATLISANLVSVHGLDPKQVGTGPFITIIMQLLQSLLPMLSGCLTPTPAPAKAEDVNARMKALTWYDRIYIHLETRKALGTLRAFKEFGAPLQTEVVKMAETTTVEETAQGMAESDALASM